MLKPRSYMHVNSDSPYAPAHARAEALLLSSFEAYKEQCEVYMRAKRKLTQLKDRYLRFHYGFTAAIMSPEHHEAFFAGYPEIEDEPE